MTGPERLTIREISRRTEIPESTLRYYRELFAEHIPTVGAGRGRRHPEAAVAVFESIAGEFGSGGSRETVRRRLESLQATEAADDGDAAVLRPGSDLVVGARAEGPAWSSAGGDGFGGLEGLVAAVLLREQEIGTLHRELIHAVRDLVGTVERLVDREGEPTSREALPAARDAPGDDDAGSGRERSDRAAVREQLDDLRSDLENEREMVERLRRAKLELEREVARLRGGAD